MIKVDSSENSDGGVSHHNLKPKNFLRCLHSSEVPLQPHFPSHGLSRPLLRPECVRFRMPFSTIKIRHNKNFHSTCSAPKEEIEKQVSQWLEGNLRLGKYVMLTSCLFRILPNTVFPKLTDICHQYLHLAIILAFSYTRVIQSSFNQAHFEDYYFSHSYSTIVYGCQLQH